jgi:hypothetical protein
MMPRRSAEEVRADDAGTPGTRVLLIAVLGSAVAWALHFAASYAVVGYACGSGWGGVRPTVIAISLAALAAASGSGWTAWRHWRVSRTVDRPEDDTWDARMGERTARVSFLMVVGIASAALFGLGIVYDAFALWIVPLCEAGGAIPPVR